jgi:ABC-type transport system involved in cytochrome c biogenesis permease subunit
MTAEQWLLIAGALAYVLYLISTPLHLKKATVPAAAFGCASIIAALSLRFFTAARVPWASLYETAALMALIIGLFLLAATLRREPRPLQVALAAIPIVLLAFSVIAWESPSSLPVSLESKWLLIHVPVAITSYGLFACSAASSAAYLYYQLKRPAEKASMARLDRVSIISTTAGLILLAAAIVMGSLWAKAAWGSYWSWDPKETWSLITALIYGLYLLLRWRGMKGEDAAYLSIVGFLCVIFTYAGVSYIIPGLHSYA